MIEEKEKELSQKQPTRRTKKRTNKMNKSLDEIQYILETAEAKANLESESVNANIIVAIDYNEEGFLMNKSANFNNLNLIAKLRIYKGLIKSLQTDYDILLATAVGNQLVDEMKLFQHLMPDIEEDYYEEDDSEDSDFQDGDELENGYTKQ